MKMNAIFVENNWKDHWTPNIVITINETLMKIIGNDYWKSTSVNYHRKNKLGKKRKSIGKQWGEMDKVPAQPCYQPRAGLVGTLWTSSGYCISWFYEKLQHVQWKRVVQGGCASPPGGCASVLGDVVWSPILGGCFTRFLNFDDFFCCLWGPRGNSRGGCAGLCG